MEGALIYHYSPAPLNADWVHSELPGLGHGAALGWVLGLLEWNLWLDESWTGREGVLEATSLPTLIRGALQPFGYSRT